MVAAPVGFRDGPMNFTRYAVYYTPAEGAFARFGAQWLGWDIAAGREAARLEVAGLPGPLEEIARTPGRYGFHATLKPPFCLAEGASAQALEESLGALAAQLPAVRAEGLELARIGGFLALVPVGAQARIGAVAAIAVETLDSFRAPMQADELARRRAGRLTAGQEAMLLRWGYPHAMEQFRFHMTLTGPLGDGDLAQVAAALEAPLRGVLPAPFLLDGLSLVGEGEDGRFRVIRRFAMA